MDDRFQKARCYRFIMHRAVQQRLGHRLDTCEWRPQLVGYVGDEIAADTLQASQVSQVAEDYHILGD